MIHGYTAGCAGCVNLGRKAGFSKNRLESAWKSVWQPPPWVDHARSARVRTAEELTKALGAKDEKLQKEMELINRNARDAATASSSTSAPGMGEQAMGEQNGGGAFGFPPVGDGVSIEDAQVELQYDAMIIDEPHQVARFGEHTGAVPGGGKHVRVRG